MRLNLAIAVIALGGFCFIIWLAIGVLGWITDQFNSLCNYLSAWEKRRVALASERARQSRLRREESARHPEEEKIETIRREDPAQVVGMPDLADIRKTVDVLKTFVAEADAYRPQFVASYAARFRETRFSFPFEFFFPRDCGESNTGPDPAQWSTTLDAKLC